jgi:hypothetical protein
MSGVTTLLQGVPSPEGRAVIALHGVLPIMRNEGTTTYACPKCRTALAENLHPNRIWDIVLECPSCQSLSEFPRLPPGASASGFLFIPAGRYVLETTLILRAQLIIGEGVISGGPPFTSSFAMS